MYTIWLVTVYEFNKRKTTDTSLNRILRVQCIEQTHTDSSSLSLEWNMPVRCELWANANELRKTTWIFSNFMRLNKYTPCSVHQCAQSKPTVRIDKRHRNIGPDFCSRYFDFASRHVCTDEETYCYSVDVAQTYSFRHTKIHFLFIRQSDNVNVCTQAMRW